MIRDIIVNLTPRADFDPACSYAISLAEAFNANITGVAFAYDPPWPPSVIEAAVVEVYRTVKESYKKEAQAALARFEEAARRSQLTAHGLLLETSLVGSVETFRDEDVDYAVRLWQAGVQCELHVWPGGFHGFDVFAPDAALSKIAVSTRNAWVRRLLAT